MTAPYELNDGEEYPYGFGLGLCSLRGRELISHGGGIPGFTCYALWLPEQNIYVAVLTNGATAGPGPGMVGRMITAMMIGDPYPQREPIELPESTIEGLVGTYTRDATPPMEISVVEDKLTLALGEIWTDTLLTESEETMFFDNSLQHVEVEWDGNTAQRLLYHFDESAPPDVYERVTEE
jgi:hypothetical protein